MISSDSVLLLIAVFILLVVLIFLPQVVLFPLGLFVVARVIKSIFRGA